MNQFNTTAAGKVLVMGMAIRDIYLKYLLIFANGPVISEVTGLLCTAVNVVTPSKMESKK